MDVVGLRTTTWHAPFSAGYDAVVVTVDAPTLGWRDRLLREGYYPFLEGEGIANYFSDPAFRDPLEEPPEEDPEAAVDRFLSILGDASLTWEDLAFVREQTDLPIVIKGVLHPEDARLAVETGADTVMLGRPFAYGLAHSGQAGVEHVLENTIPQVDLTMGLAGIDDVDDIDRAAVRDAASL